MLLNYLFDENPYDDFPIAAFDLDHTGFNLPNKVLNKVLEVKPSKIIEVGTWKGNSAFYMADLLRQNGVDFEMVCVDTWLGAKEMWIKEERSAVPERREGLKMQCGYPTLYYQFLANVIKKEYKDCIVPFPNTSTVAFTVLQHLEYQAQFIYIDGSHEATDAHNDITNYWKLLEPGGIMCGDDYFWDGVHAAVNGHVAKTGCEYGVYPEEYSWWVRKLK